MSGIVFTKLYSDKDFAFDGDVQLIQTRIDVVVAIGPAVKFNVFPETFFAIFFATIVGMNVAVLPMSSYLAVWMERIRTNKLQYEKTK